MNTAAMEFIGALSRQTDSKSKLYDGINARLNPNEAIVLAVEELGEISTELTRKRYYSAVYECVDLAHGAMLIALSLDPEGKVLAMLDNHRLTPPLTG